MEGCGRGQDFESEAVGLGTRNRHETLARKRKHASQVDVSSGRESSISSLVGKIFKEK